MCMMGGLSRKRSPPLLLKLRGRAALNLALPEDPDTALQHVAAISGALMLMPRTLFARIGGFDPGYRLHVEDLDLCRRAREAGAIVAVANDVRVLHLRGISSRSRPVFVEWHKHRRMWRYFQKFEARHVGTLSRVLVWLGIWGHFGLGMVLGKNPKTAIATDTTSACNPVPPHQTHTPGAHAAGTARRTRIRSARGIPENLSSAAGGEWRGL